MADIPKTGFDWSPVITGTFTILSGLAVFASTQYADYVKDRRSKQIEADKRRFATLDKRYERNNISQRNTLVQLQEALYLLDTCIIGLTVRRRLGNVNSTEWVDDWPLEFSNQVESARQSCELFVVRVLDEKVRELYGLFTLAMRAVFHAASLTNSEQSKKVASEAHRRLNERIGEIVRELDSIEPPY